MRNLFQTTSSTGIKQNQIPNNDLIDIISISTFLIVLVFIYILYQLEQNDADDKLLNNLKAVVRRMSVNIEINRLFRHL